ncbi:MAG: lytic transglycosylase domain-containing protein [Armatimonadetes bacterium]|nr:lytic transglycosylase domain-containing protein [Armatimonadota bacterium]
MLDDLSAIQARIQEIQGRLASLGGAPPAAPPALPDPGSAQATPPPSFAATLHQAQESAAPVPVTPPGIKVPPASLGPLPPMPVSPSSPNVVPIHAASGDYDGLIQTYAAKHGLDPSLVRAVIHTESGGNPRAVSRAGAMGLMQLMPANVKEAGVTDPFDPEQNIAAGTKQLSDLMQTFHGDLDLALAGYNAGPGNVRKYGGVPPFAETQNYIRKVRAAMGKD